MAKWADVSEHELVYLVGVGKEIKALNKVIRQLKHADETLKGAPVPKRCVDANRLLINEALLNLENQLQFYEKTQSDCKKLCKKEGHVGEWEQRESKIIKRWNAFDGDYKEKFVWSEKICVRCGFKEKTEKRRAIEW